MLSSSTSEVLYSVKMNLKNYKILYYATAFRFEIKLRSMVSKGIWNYFLVFLFSNNLVDCLSFSRISSIDIAVLVGIRISN